MKKVKSQGGFSLIELMMVVVIIGVLAGVGIPQYQKFQMKARQSEVKSLLSSMYTSQKAFYAEWNQYYGDFNAVGYGLSGDLGYNVGFNSSGQNGPVTHPNPTYKNSPPVVRAASVMCPSSGAQGCTVVKSRTTATISGTAANRNNFRFGGVANLDDDGGLDEWTINQNKVFVQVSDDITN
ncbi:MAG: type IV pilin protein [Bdellovibrionales bacterium]